MVEEKIFEGTVSFLFVAVGYIFRSITGRIKKLEEKPACRYSDIDKRVKTVEIEQKETRPILVDIQTRLAEVHTDIKWIKKNK